MDISDFLDMDIDWKSTNKFIDDEFGDDVEEFFKSKSFKDAKKIYNEALWVVVEAYKVIKDCKGFIKDDSWTRYLSAPLCLEHMEDVNYIQYRMGFYKKLIKYLAQVQKVMKINKRKHHDVAVPKTIVKDHKDSILMLI